MRAIEIRIVRLDLYGPPCNVDVLIMCLKNLKRLKIKLESQGLEPARKKSFIFPIIFKKRSNVLKVWGILKMSKSPSQRTKNLIKHKLTRVVRHEQ